MKKILKCFFVALPHLDITCCTLHNWVSEKGEPEKTTVNKTKDNKKVRRNDKKSINQ